MNPERLQTKNDKDLVLDPANVGDVDQILALALEALANGENDRVHDRALVHKIVTIVVEDIQLAHVHDLEGDRALEDDRDPDLEDGKSQGPTQLDVSARNQRNDRQKRKTKKRSKLMLIFDAALLSLRKLKRMRRTQP